MAVELVTERFYLHRWQDRFVEHILEMNADAQVMQFIGNGSPLQINSSASASSLEWQKTQFQRTDGLGLWGICEKETSVFCGWAGIFEFEGIGPDFELAYRLPVQVWGRGIATEAGGILLDHAFKNLDLPMLRAVTYPENEPSRHVLGKLGFRYRGMCHYRDVPATDYRLHQKDYRRMH